VGALAEVLFVKEKPKLFAITLRGTAFFAAGVAIIAMAANLGFTSPQPGMLADLHASVPGLDGREGCAKCHADAGLTAGCKACHEEIAHQVDLGTGLHGKYARDGKNECGTCHAEHFGADFPLVNATSWDHRDPRRFKHDHVAFDLHEAHDKLKCEECHRGKGFLGETQACAGCHKNVHGDEMSDQCTGCHTQKAWKPAAKFDHSQHFPLVGRHATVECGKCHVETRETDPMTHVISRVVFGKSPGTHCQDCHVTPHARGGQAIYGADCARCHTEADFKELKYTLADHSTFPVLGAHATIACAACHDLEKPLPDAQAATRCDSCHVDAHQGRIAGACTQCHFDGDVKFSDASPRMDAARHASLGMVLAGPHAHVACDKCHGPAPTYLDRFPGRKENDCLACHQDPHGGQFKEKEPDCKSCHPGDRFVPSAITAANHQPVLRERHAELECKECHKIPEDVKYVGTAKECQGCHADPHNGQFDKLKMGCADCHDERKFKPATFLMERHDPPLTGAHATTDCAKCHVAPKAGEPVVFVGAPRECAACHKDPHGGQFEPTGKKCEACHDTVHFAPVAFGPMQHQPPLLGAHLAVACNACHVVDAAGIRRFMKTPETCKSCHADPHRGQLTADDVDCNKCHRSNDHWLPVTFDHDRDSRFKLEGEHARVTCASCHPNVTMPDGAQVVRYKPIGIECRDCHEPN
jgi:hypothetical protein